MSREKITRFFDVSREMDPRASSGKILRVKNRYPESFRFLGRPRRLPTCMSLYKPKRLQLRKQISQGVFLAYPNPSLSIEGLTPCLADLFLQVCTWQDDPRAPRETTAAPEHNGT